MSNAALLQLNALTPKTPKDPSLAAYIAAEPARIAATIIRAQSLEWPHPDRPRASHDWCTNEAHFHGISINGARHSFPEEECDICEGAYADLINAADAEHDEFVERLKHWVSKNEDEMDGFKGAIGVWEEHRWYLDGFPVKAHLWTGVAGVEKYVPLRIRCVWDEEKDGWEFMFMEEEGSEEERQKRQDEGKGEWKGKGEEFQPLLPYLKGKAPEQSPHWRDPLPNPIPGRPKGKEHLLYTRVEVGYKFEHFEKLPLELQIMVREEFEDDWRSFGEGRVPMWPVGVADR